MRAILTIAVVSCIGTSSALAQQTLWGALMATGLNPSVAAQEDFKRAVADYRKCLNDNPGNVNACEGLRHIMDANACAAGHCSR